MEGKPRSYGKPRKKTYAATDDLKEKRGYANWERKH
jgi:hypothetical protein